MKALITSDMLRQATACPEQVEIFGREWPAGAEVTLENVRRAVALNLNLRWFAVKFFTAEARSAFAAARRAAYMTYFAVLRTGERDYYTSSDEALTLAMAVYTAARTAAACAYDDACATAFFETFELREGVHDEDHT